MKKVVTQVIHEVPNNRYCIDKETGEKCRWTKLNGIIGIPAGYCMLHKVNLQMQFNWVPLKCLQCRRSVVKVVKVNEKNVKEQASKCVVKNDGYYFPKPHPIPKIKNEKLRKEIEDMMKQYCREAR